MARKRRGDNRNVGDLGEDDFRRWCTLNQLERTKSGPDRMGWDYLVEFKQTLNAQVALDSQNELKKALVQVKASDRSQRSIVAKLSALKQLVDADLPAFIVSLHYEEGSSPCKAWLLHVGRVQIEAILRKVREWESRGRCDLHAAKFRLSLNEAISLRLDGSDLGPQLEACIGASMAEYVASKSGFRSSCGYDGAAFVGSVQLAPGVGLSDIADWQIGRIPHLPIEGGTMNKVRFGIALAKEAQHFGDALATVELKPLMRGSVAICSDTHATTVELALDIYGSDPSLGEEVWRLRFVNPFIEIYVPADRCWEVDFKIDPARRYRLSELVQALKFGWLLSEAGSRLAITTSGHTVDQEVPINAIGQLAHFQNLYAFADRLSTALHRYKPDLAVLLTVQDIDDALWANERAYCLLSRPGFALSLEVTDPAALERAGAKTGVIIVPLSITLKSIVYYAVVRIELVSMRLDAATLHLRGGEPVVVHDGIAQKHNLSGLVERISKRVVQLRSRENDQARMVVGVKGMIVGLIGDGDSGMGEISW